MALGLSVGASLVNWTLATSTADADSVDNESLLCTESETASLIWARWSWGAVQFGELAVLPAAHAKQVSQHITLLFAVQLLYVSVCTHVLQSRIDLATKSECFNSLIRSHIIGLSRSGSSTEGASSGNAGR